MQTGPGAVPKDSFYHVKTSLVLKRFLKKKSIRRAEIGKYVAITVRGQEPSHNCVHGEKNEL